MTTAREYYKQVVTRDGYTLILPRVAAAEDLLQDVPVNPYAISETQQFPIGTTALAGIDGYRYCKNGGTELAIGVPTQSAAAHHAEGDDNIVIGAGSDIGETHAHLTSTDNLDAGIGATKDAFKDGYIHFHLAAGAGQTYQIKGNAAFDASETVVQFDLYDPLTIALTTSSRCGIIQNPYKNVIASTAVAAGIFTGIPQLVVTLNYYFWSKLAGPSCVFGNAAIAKGTSVVIGTTAGTTDPGAAASTEIIIGYPLTPYTSTDDLQFMVMLQGNLW